VHARVHVREAVDRVANPLERRRAGSVVEVDPGDGSASGDRNRQVNRFLPALAASVYAIMREQGIDIPYSSRVEHIAAGGVAKYPDIVKLSLDEIAAEFEGLVNRPGNE